MQKKAATDGSQAAWALKLPIPLSPHPVCKKKQQKRRKKIINLLETSDFGQSLNDKRLESFFLC